MDRKDRRDVMHSLSLIIQLGFTVIVPTMLLTFLGVWLDKKFNTWFTIPLVILGISGGIFGAWSLIRKMNVLKDEPKEEYDLMAGWHTEEESKENESRTEELNKEVSGQKKG